jgi:hypothetical protein
MYNSSYSWWNWKPPAGFRFSATDGVAIVLCALLTWGTRSFLGELALLFPVVLGHFFLFCNVFRIPRRPELLWSALFIVNVTALTSADLFAWSRVLLAQSPVTVTFIALTVFGKDYHGVGYLLVPWGRRCANGGDTEGR